ncbi:Glutathione S-transferase, partial [Trachymyrmex cornetzi]
FSALAFPLETTTTERREEARPHMSVSMQIDSGMLTNSDTSLCRVCLTVDHNNQCIFRRTWDDPESPSGLSEKLQLCCGVEVLEDDGLPTSICLECVVKVNVAYELRKQCQKADVELRKLYGKSLKTSIASIPTKDQRCQTDQSFILDAISSSDNIELSADNEVDIEKTIMQSNVMRQEQILDAFDQIKQNVSVDNEVDLDCGSKYKQVEHDKIANRTRNENGYRTRRLMFKRVTSIENLRNYKERQRRYIKKSVNVKRDSSDSEYQTKARNVHGRMDRASEMELQYKCQKCDRFYSSKKSLDRHTSTHNDKEFKCDSCDKQFFCLDKLHKHINLHRAKEKPKPVLCKICNKSFRKIDTMVRHLNTHKKAYPKDVFSILKEIRDKRRLENNPESFETSLTLDEDEEVAHDGQFQSANNGNTRELRKRNNTKVELRDSDLVNSDSSDDKTESFDDASLFNCKHCSKSYRTERSLQRHLLVHEEKKYVCNVCNMKFFRQDRLKSHMDRYGHDETKMCSEPQKPPDDKSAIKLINTWIREELDSDNEGKGFPCRICGKSYDTKKSLLKHQMNAHGGHNEYCTSCGAQQQQVSYSQSPQTTGGISVASTSSVVAPIITTLPQAHLNVINSTLNVQANKDYVDNVQRMNAHAATNATTVVSPGLHPNVDISEMSSAVRNFSIIGQINMPSYKLIYFPITALAEPIRFLFSYAGIEFEDERFDRNDWAKLKPTMPFGKVPVLEVDGKKIDQSTAISRYLAKQCGLAGKNDWESLEIDSTVDTIHDVRASIASFHYESNETAKNEKLKASKETTVPYYLERLDAQVKKNGGYFVGGSLTWADLVFVGLLDYLNFMMKEDIVEKYENLKQLQKTVEEVPAIKNWIEKRPPAVFSPN